MADKAPQTDAWAEAAKNFKAAPQGEAAPAGGNDDWKLWQENGGDAGAGSPPATDWLSKLIGQKEQPAIESALQPSMHDKDAGVFSNIMTGMGNVAKGAGHMLTHPEELVTGAVTGSIPGVFVNDLQNAYKHVKGEPNAGDEMAQHPAEGLEYGLGEMLPLALTGGAESLPSKGRAAGVFADIERQAANTPVPMTETGPAAAGFKDFVRTGGRNARVMTKLGNRLGTEQPMSFPEARDFYSNVGEASARPGFLRRAIESPSAPKMRYQLGGVRQAMNSDLTNALPPELSDRYTNALREYAQAAKLGKVAKGAGAVALAEGLRRSGILGKIFSSVAQ